MSSAGQGTTALALAALALQPVLAPPPGAAAPPSTGDAAVARVNGEVPPGLVTPAFRVELLLRTAAGPGHQTLMYRTTRLPGTRAPIHFHYHSGTTCVLQGESTLRVQGRVPVRYVTGQCFVMPSGVAMANVNSGTTPMVTLDVFTVPLAGQVWRPVEPGHHSLAGQFEQVH